MQPLRAPWFWVSFRQRVIVRKPVLVVAALLSLLLVFSRQLSPQRAQSARAERDTPGNILVNVRFALNDRASTDWSGELEVSGGRLEKLEGWHFPFVPTGAAQPTPPAQPSRITGANSWEAHSLPGPGPTNHVDLSPILPTPRPVWPLGLLVFLNGDAQTRLTLKFRKHEPVSFTVGQLEQAAAQFQDGAVEAERLPQVHRVASEPESGQSGEADYPSVAVARDGAVWVAWQEYRSGSDRVRARRFAGGTWGEPVTLLESGDVYKTAVAEAGDGRLWVVWAAREGADWHLWGRSLDVRASGVAKDAGRAWSAAEKLSTAPGPNLHHKLAADAKGRLWLVWQGFERGQSDIFLRIYENGRWSPATRVSESAANDWEPSVAVDRAGRGWIVWDTYAPATGRSSANYDVVARSFDGAKLSPLVPIAASARSEAHASVAVDGRGRVWVAYDEAGENWGKDWGFLVRDRGIGLYLNRVLRVVGLDNGKLVEPEQEIAAALPASMQLYASLPSIHADESGRIWVVFRYLAGARTRVVDGWGAQGGWETAAISYSGERWERALPLARSLGRNDGRASAVVINDGRADAALASGARLVVAYAADHRPFLSANVQDYGVYLSEVAAAARPAPATAEPRLRPRQMPTADQLPTHPREAQDVARLRDYRARVGSQTLRIVRGDLHRHTDISGDGIGDGSLLDTYRYALDAAAMDYIAVTDHGAGNDLEYSWWRTQKSAGLFLVPGSFTPLYGYERSLLYPNGHRNVVFAQRGVRTLPSSPEERQGKEGAAKLYRYLKENSGLAFVHTIATDQGTDWRDNDPVVEPLVEICQGFRNSYEHEGAPKSATADRPFLFKSGYRPLGFYWNALAKGYKLGVQASSDHISTHLSYACLYTTGLSRQQLLDAMRARRSYGATDNILLDYRLVEPGGAEHLMGAQVTLSGTPRLKVHAVGTAPIQRVDIIKNGRYVYTSEPGKPEAEVTFSDPEAAPGESYYYVRVRQYDGQLAWSSPIWVVRK